MLPDIGASEYLIIAVVALVVIGPKDLPKVLRTLGQWVAKMRGMASEFRASFDEMARQSELDELRKEVEAMRKGQLMSPASLVAQEAGAAEVQQTFDDIHEGLRGEGIGFPPMMSSNPSAALEMAQAGGSESGAPEPIVTGPAEAPKPKRPRRAATKTVIANETAVAAPAAKPARAPKAAPKAAAAKKKTSTRTKA